MLDVPRVYRPLRYGIGRKEIRHIEIDGYSSSVSDHEDEEDNEKEEEEEEECEINRLDGKIEADDMPYWKRSALPYHDFRNESPSRDQEKFQRERHRFDNLIRY